MAVLLSPGVSVSVIDQSFYLPVTATTVPLFFIATESNKLQPDGVTPASGTLEHSVVRTVTSRKQLRELYGEPVFRADISGNQFHGDARNEYGLAAADSFLSIGNRAFIVRANINLDDTPQTFMSLGTPVAGPISFTGLGTGSIGPITVAGPQVKPQTITVTFTSSTQFRVVGSEAGNIVNGNVGVAIPGSAQVSFTVTAGATPFAAGDKFTFVLGYQADAGLSNVGDGTVVGLRPDDLLAANPLPITITFTSPTAFSVVYPVGPAGVGSVNVPYDDGRLNFTIVPGATDFGAGDTFDVIASSITVANPLGTTDAQRRLAITTALSAAINSNVDVVSELYEYNLILAPGYHELGQELVALSAAVKDEAFALIDPPCNLTPEQMAQWSLSVERVASSSCAYYYPWAVMSLTTGVEVLVPPSAVAVTTIAYSDNQSYVWFAPAGLGRGRTFNVANVGYVTGDLGTATTFVGVALNEGQRDNLYEAFKNVNPIVFFPGRGIVVWGQKTSQGFASARDRINVERMIMYIRRVLRKGAMPFVFEPNDQITRDNLKAAADGMLNDILVKRGLTDFATYCDETNNSAAQIDRNEMHLDVAIKPTKAAEFIYIPITVVATNAEI